MKKPAEVKKTVKRDSKSLDDLVASLPVPKIKPKAEQKKDITNLDEKIISVGKVVKECRDALNEFNLVKLVSQAKVISFKEMKKSEQELLCAGLIKLGEALTFCKDEANETLCKIGIIDIAQSCVKARNHFVHHQLYHMRLNMQIEVTKCINGVSLISTLEEKLMKLQKSGLVILAKPIIKPENNFPFEYAHFVRCLKAEFTELKDILAVPDIHNKISSETALRAALENRIRNILAIMVDLTDEARVNMNNSNYCAEQKEVATEINKIFSTQADLAELFIKHKEYRNSLCHLDATLKKPYTNYGQIIAFANDLINVEKLRVH